ncbi:MAG: hypothetical protein KDA86_11625 [Planctomycetaceae bacterium]|nr:hypothetical protein [Planctomycetaceae bacterium]
MNTFCPIIKIPAFLSMLCLLGLFSGCQKEEFVDTRERVAVVPVTGKILLDGKPLVGPAVAKIVMHPADSETEEGIPADVPAPSAWTEADGTTFKMGSYEGGDGAPVGTYKLTIDVGKRSLMNGSFKRGPLDGKYADPENPVQEITVTGDEGSIDLGTIELTSD